MAKINRASRLNDLWQVRIDVDDPDCKWNIKPVSTYYKLIKANNENAAVRKAANHCNSQMNYFPGTHFKYSTKDIRPYIRPVGNEYTEQIEKPLVSFSKY